MLPNVKVVTIIYSKEARNARALRPCEISSASEDRPRRGAEEKRADRLGNRCHIV